MSQQQTPSKEDLRKAGYSQAEIDLMTDEERRQEYNDLTKNWYSSKRGKQNGSTTEDF